MLKIILSLIVVLGMSIATPLLAHPGNTASDGCHYCRTNCDKCGEEYGERHCHGGGIVIPQFSPQITLTPKKPVVSSPLFSPTTQVEVIPAPIAPVVETDDS